MCLVLMNFLFASSPATPTCSYTNTVDLIIDRGMSQQKCLTFFEGRLKL